MAKLIRFFNDVFGRQVGVVRERDLPEFDGMVPYPDRLFGDLPVKQISEQQIKFIEAVNSGEADEETAKRLFGAMFPHGNIFYNEAVIFVRELNNDAFDLMSV